MDFLLSLDSLDWLTFLLVCTNIFLALWVRELLSIVVEYESDYRQLSRYIQSKFNVGEIP